MRSYSPVCFSFIVSRVCRSVVLHNNRLEIENLNEATANVNRANWLILPISPAIIVLTDPDSFLFTKWPTDPQKRENLRNIEKRKT